MVRIRLTRLGATKRPFYRVVVADSRSPRNGRSIESVGHYDPRAEPAVLKLDLERIDHWVAHGAQPSETVSDLIRRARSAAAAAPSPVQSDA